MLRLRVGQLCTCTPQPVTVQPTTNQLRGQILSKISIVVTSFNKCGFIVTMLQSIINQRHPNFKLIIIDGVLTDNMLSEIKQYTTYNTWWVRESDSSSRSIHQVVDYFVKNPETQVVPGTRFLTNEDNLKIGRWVLPRQSNRLLKGADSLPQEAHYSKRKAWNQIGARLYEFFRFEMHCGGLLRFASKQIDIHHFSYSWGYFVFTNNKKYLTKCS